MSDPDYLIQSLRGRFGTFSWQGQALQYDQLGAPDEIVYRRFTDDFVNSTVGRDTVTDTLLYYDEQGHLAGILNHYPYGAVEHDGTVLEKPHNVNLFIRPDVDGSGNMVAKRLFDESQRRWNVNAETPMRIAVGTDTVHTMAGAFIDGNRRIARLSDLK